MSDLPALNDLLHHRPPALLLDRVLELNAQVCRTLVLPKEHAWYLQEDGLAPSWLGLEWMAQTAAAYSGYRHRMAGRPPRIGFLLGTQAYEVLQPFFRVGEAYEVLAEALFLDDSGPGAFACEIRHGGQRLAHARLKAIETP